MLYKQIKSFNFNFWKKCSFLLKLKVVAIGTFLNLKIIESNGVLFVLTSSFFSVCHALWHKKTRNNLYVQCYKGAVDTLDKMCGDMAFSRKTRRRWPFCVFYGILKIAFVNSYVIYCINNIHVWVTNQWKGKPSWRICGSN